MCALKFPGMCSLNGQMKLGIELTVIVESSR
jgi:hypothetical protein